MDPTTNDLPRGKSPVARSGNRGQHDTMRTLGTSDRYFWTSTSQQLLNIDVVDRRFGIYKRLLLTNDKTALALNEVAADSGRGYFQQLPAHSTWKNRGK